MKENQELNHLLPRDLLEEVGNDYGDKLSNTISDENNKIFDEPSSDDEGISIKHLETVRYLLFKIYILIIFNK